MNLEKKKRKKNEEVNKICSILLTQEQEENPLV